MGRLGDMQHDIERIRELLEDELAKKRKIQKMTPEDRAERGRHFQMSRERMAYHQAKSREEERKRKSAGSA